MSAKQRDKAPRPPWQPHDRNPLSRALSRPAGRTAGPPIHFDPSGAV